MLRGGSWADRPGRGARAPSATGTTRSAARSSPASAAPRRRRLSRVPPPRLLGPPVPVADAARRAPPHSLLDQCTERRASSRAAATNPDGWGVGLVRRRPADAVRYRSATARTTRSGHDARSPRSTALRADRVRGPRPPQVARAPRSRSTGNAPFVAGPLAVRPQRRRRRLPRRRRRRAASPASRRAARRAIEGDADSEVLFALVLDRIDAGDATRPRRSPTSIEPSATRDRRPVQPRCSPTATQLARHRLGQLALHLRRPAGPDGVDRRLRAVRRRPAAGNGSPTESLVADRRHARRASPPTDRRASMTEPDRPRRRPPSPSTCHSAPTTSTTRCAPTCAPGLTAQPKELPPKWFYDDRGCELFDEITRLPEYYPTEAERAILRRARPRRSSRAIRRRHARRARLGHVGQDPRCCSTRSPAPGSCAASCPFESARPPCAPRPRDDRRAIPGRRGARASSATSSATSADPAAAGRRMVAFLGSTIGNFAPDERAPVPRRPRRRACGPGDSLLLGTDLVKDVDRLEAAYDDAAGVTAEFNLQRAARHEPRARRRLRPRPVRPRRPLRPRRRVDRDAAALAGRPDACTIARPRPRRSTSPRARRCAPRSAPSSAGTGVEAELAAAGLRARRGG